MVVLVPCEVYFSPQRPLLGPPPDSKQAWKHFSRCFDKFVKEKVSLLLPSACVLKPSIDSELCCCEIGLEGAATLGDGVAVGARASLLSAGQRWFPYLSWGSDDIVWFLLILPGVSGTSARAWRSLMGEPACSPPSWPAVTPNRRGWPGSPKRCALRAVPISFFLWNLSMYEC